jgi:hypothetical protein
MPPHFGHCQMPHITLNLDVDVRPAIDLDLVHDVPLSLKGALDLLDHGPPVTTRTVDAHFTRDGVREPAETVSRETLTLQEKLLDEATDLLPPFGRGRDAPTLIGIGFHHHSLGEVKPLSTEVELVRDAGGAEAVLGQLEHTSHRLRVQLHVSVNVDVVLDLHGTSEVAALGDVPDDEDSDIVVLGELV